jgi:hypothetical protein
MTQMLIRPDLRVGPSITERDGELLDVATVQEGADWFMTTGVFESYNCIGTDSKTSFVCPATVLSAPVQAAATTATSGGTLAAGTYRAKITAVNARGETIASNEISRTTTGSTSTITWSWAAVSGATGYNVYVTNVNGAADSETFLASTTGTSYVWTGTPAWSSTAAKPPTSNTAVVSVTKTFETPGYVDGIQFNVYGGALCKSVGNSLDHEKAELERAFRANESVGVERALMQTRFTTPAATDITPAAGAVDPKVGLALLEQDAAANYAGVPTIHVSRGIGSLLFTANAIQKQGNRYYSWQGSKVASGGGYGAPNNGPTGAAPAAGEQWIYASGEVLIARGGLFSEVTLNRDTNEVVALVERPYVAAVDCYAAAVRVKVA